jgi:hypothetical protein
MSDLLTHWAVFEDLRRFAQVDPLIEPLFARLMDKEREYARLGAITRGGSRIMPQVLASARAQYPGADPHKLELRLAFALGMITHFPTDQVLKPLMSELAQADWSTSHNQAQGKAGIPRDTRQDMDTIREISAYYDVHVFRQVYLGGHEEPFTHFLVGENPTPPGQALEEFARALFQRSLLASHTFEPDWSNLDGWLDNLIGKVQPLYVHISNYTRVFNHPDPAKMAQYQVETGFYLQSDPAILAARRLQRGELVSQAELFTAWAPRANQSGYGRVLELGVQTLRAASAYWQGRSEDLPDVRQGFKWVPKG